MMMQFFKQHKKGIIGAALFHFLLLLFLIIGAFTSPTPLLQEEGILINFGNSDEGTGLIEPESNVEQEPQVQQTQSKPVESIHENILTQNYEKSVGVDKSDKKKVTETDQEEETEQHKVIEKSMFKKNSANNNTSNGEGETGKQGNQGREDGDINSPYHEGHGKGNKGVSFSLTGRNSKSLPAPEYPGNEQGKVIVEVTVDREGKVTKAIPGAIGTTTNNQQLWEAAKKAALNARFDKKTDAPTFQKGTITYRFIILH